MIYREREEYVEVENPKFVMSVVYGSVKPCLSYEFTDTGMICYSYSIRYDEYGNEVSRTKPEEISRLYME